MPIRATRWWKAAAGFGAMLPPSAVAHVTPQTVAALPPAATNDIGARVPFTEYEAENAATSGATIIGPDRRFTAIAAEASGRRAVRLDQPGQYVEFTLAKPANAMTVRAAVPDDAGGRGVDASLRVVIDGEPAEQLTVTSRYGWFYGHFPFSNNPADGAPHHYFDETRIMLGRTLAAGTRVRLQVPKKGAAAWYVIDLADFELAPPPLQKPEHALSVVDFGADPRGLTSSRGAFERAIESARAAKRPVWIPPGRYRVDGHLLVDNITIRGAEPWYSIVRGKRLGFYGRTAPRGSYHVRLEDFAIIGEVAERNLADHVNGVGGAMNDSVIRDLFIQHEKAGLWFDGPMHNIQVENLRITDTTADGINFHRGVNHAIVANSFIRNTGDDGLAAWSQGLPDQAITFQHNTVVAPILANGIAIYGGRNIRVEANLVADTLTEGGGLHVGNRFGAAPVRGTIDLIDNAIVRGGCLDPNWKFGIGALWFYALDAPMTATIHVEGNRLIDSTDEAVMFIGKRIAGIVLDRLRIERTGGAAITVRSPGEASLSNSSATGLGTSPVLQCHGNFVLDDEGGNRGFDALTRGGPSNLSNITGTPCQEKTE